MPTHKLGIRAPEINVVREFGTDATRRCYVPNNRALINKRTPVRHHCKCSGTLLAKTC